VLRAFGPDPTAPLNSWTDEDADDDDEFQPPPDDQNDSDEEYRDDKGVRVSSTDV